MLTLYHTFEGDDPDRDGVKSCPLDDDPLTQGDKCPDTQPHINYFPTPTYNECIDDNFDLNTKKNIMSYFLDRFLFTNDQKNRMRAVLELDEQIRYYEGELFNTGLSETPSRFTRLVSQDRRCEAGFYGFPKKEFLIKSFNYQDEIYTGWKLQYNLTTGDDYDVFAEIENGLFTIKAKNNGAYYNRWISDNSSCSSQNKFIVRLENKYEFSVPHCVLSIYGDNGKVIWQSNLNNGVDVLGNQENNNPTVFFKNKRFKDNSKSELNTTEKLIDHWQVSNAGEFNYLISPDKTKVVIKNASNLEVLQESATCPKEYLNSINVFPLEQ